MTKTATPEPTTLDHAPIDTDQQCPMWTGDDEPEPCSNTAEFVFVYEASSDPNDDRRRNCLACADCVPVDTQ